MNSSTTNNAIIKTYPQGTIELSQHHDLPAIHSIIKAAYSPYIPRLNGKHPAPITADYTALINADELFILRPSPGSTTSTSTSPSTSISPVVGTISLSLSSTSSSVLELNNLAVDPTAQGKGHGKLLMQFAEHFASTKACHTIELYTNVKMVENLKLYAKLGFIEVGRWEEDGFERVFFRKEGL